MPCSIRSHHRSPHQVRRRHADPLHLQHLHRPHRHQRRHAAPHRHTRRRQRRHRRRSRRHRHRPPSPERAARSTARSPSPPQVAALRAPSAPAPSAPPAPSMPEPPPSPAPTPAMSLPPPPTCSPSPATSTSTGATLAINAVTPTSRHLHHRHLYRQPAPACTRRTPCLPATPSNYDDANKEVEPCSHRLRLRHLGRSLRRGPGSEGGDLDNDGLTNFEEYAFGLIPDSGSSVNPISAVRQVHRPVQIHPPQLDARDRRDLQLRILHHPQRRVDIFHSRLRSLQRRPPRPRRSP